VREGEEEKLAILAISAISANLTMTEFLIFRVKL